MAADLETRIAALEDAQARGVLEVTDEYGRTVRYPSPTELTKALAQLYGQRESATPGRRPFRVCRFKDSAQ